METEDASGRDHLARVPRSDVTRMSGELFRRGLDDLPTLDQEGGWLVDPVEFRAAAKQILEIVPQETTIPLLRRLLLNFDGVSLWIHGTDLDRYGAIQVGARGSVYAELAVEAEDVALLLSDPSDHNRIHLHHGDAGNMLVLGNQAVPCLPRSCFVERPEVDFHRGCNLAGRDLRTVVERTVFAAGSDPARPMLTASLLEMRDREITAVATNGHWLARCSRKGIITSDEEIDLLVPPSTLQKAAEWFGEDRDLRIVWSDTHIAFHTDSLMLYGRQIEGPYPEYSHILPELPSSEVVLDRDGLLEALVRLPDSEVTSLRVSWGESDFHFNYPGDLESLQMVDPRLPPSGSCVIGVNRRYLQGIAEHMPSGPLRVGYCSCPRNPSGCPNVLSFRPLEDDDCLVMLCPLRIVEAPAH